MKRTAWVDAAKGISILLVVLIHATDWLGYAGLDAPSWLQTTNRAVRDLRMPTFFAMAGLFSGKWIVARWRDLAAHKLATLVWVFLLWQVTMVAYKTLGGAVLPEQQDAGLVAQVARALASPVRPNAELWFLWALVVFLIVARCTQRLSPRTVVAAAAALSIIWSTVAIPVLGDEGMRLLGPGLGTAPMYLVFFLGAVRYAAPIREVASSASAVAAGLVATGWLVVFVVVGVEDSLREMPGVRFACQIFGVLGGVAFGLLLQRVRPLVYLGSQTLGVYVSHTATIVTIACALYALDVELTGWTVVGAVTIAVAVGLLLSRLASDTWLLSSPRWFSRAAAGDAIGVRR